MRSFLLLASLVAYAAATGRPLGNRLAELVHQDPLNEEKICLLYTSPSPRD